MDARVRAVVLVELEQCELSQAQRLYAGRAYAPERERKRLAALVRRGAPPDPFGFSGDSTPSETRWRPPADAPPPENEEPSPERHQLEAQATLF